LPSLPPSTNQHTIATTPHNTAHLLAPVLLLCWTIKGRVVQVKKTTAVPSYSVEGAAERGRDGSMGA